MKITAIALILLVVVFPLGDLRPSDIFYGYNREVAMYILFIAAILFVRLALWLRYGVLADAIATGLESRDVRLWVAGFKEAERFPSRDAYLSEYGRVREIFNLTKWGFEDFYPGLLEEWRKTGRPGPPI